MTCVWVHGCDRGRVSDGSRLALYQAHLFLLYFFGMCVCFLPLYSGRQVRWILYTSRGHTGGRSHRISHPPFPSAVHAFIFFAKRIQPFLSLVDREVEFCVCVFSSHSFWTSKSLDVPAGVTRRRKVTQDFSSTFFLRCCVLNDFIVLHYFLGIFYFYFLF